MRLNEADVRLGHYNRKMAREASASNVAFYDAEEHFDRWDLSLWSNKDIVHVSANFGLPRLVKLILEQLEKIEAEVEDTEKVRGPRVCPAFI